MRNEPALRPIRPGFLAGLGALAAVTCLAYRISLFQVPWGSDAEKWLSRADPSNPNWAKWVFQSRHFIGWRPVTAFSFTLNGWLGSSPVAIHAVDYTALFATIVLVGLVGWEMFRQDRDDRGAVAAALGAAVAVAVHPVIQEVVPYVARRSYGLGEAFGLAGLLLWLPELRGPARILSPRIALATILLALGYGSNEASFPIAAILPFLAWNANPPRDASAGLAELKRVVVPTIPAAILAIARNFVLADDFATGYVKKWFAYASDGRNRLVILESFEPLKVFRAAWTYVLFPSSGNGADSLLWGENARIGAVLAVGILGWLAVVGLVLPVARRADPVARRPLVLLGWAAMTAGLYAVANTWFWREGYPLLIPLALALAASFRAAFTSGRRLEARVAGAVLAVLAVSMGAWSPVLRGGWDGRPVAEEAQATRILHSMGALLPDVPAYGYIWLVVPGDESFADDIERAAQHMRASSTQHFRLLAWVPRNDAARAVGPVAAVETGSGPPQLALNALGTWEPTARQQMDLGTAHTVAISRLHPGGTRRAQVWWWDGPDYGDLKTAVVPAPRQ